MNRNKTISNLRNRRHKSPSIRPFPPQASSRAELFSSPLVIPRLSAPPAASRGVAAVNFARRTSGILFHWKAEGVNNYF
ncbi:unnamed protein product [Victoria cruziana]